nr:MAG TPA: hypothetical protein [Caudoviricetes sp.]
MRGKIPLIENNVLFYSGTPNTNNGFKISLRFCRRFRVLYSYGFRYRSPYRKISTLRFS